MLPRYILAVTVSLSLAACGTPQPIELSRDLWSQGNVEASVQTLGRALARDPNNHQLKSAYERQRELALSQLTIAADHLLDARQYDEARRMLQSALRLDPGYPRALDSMARLDTVQRLDGLLDQARSRLEAGDLSGAEARLHEIVTQDPDYAPARRLQQQLRQKQGASASEPVALKAALNTPISLDLRDTPLRNVFDAFSQTAGLNFVFDRDVRTDSKVTILIRNSSVADVLRLILSTNALERKILNENTVLIYPNTAAKAREYQALVVRTFYLVNADAKQVQSLLKSMARVKEVYIDEKLNLVTIRDTPEAVRLAERLVESVDVADSEVMLEVEVMELSRTRAQQIGLQFPTQATHGLASGASMIPTSALGQAITSISNPLLVANLFMQDTDANLLANPRIRVKNREKAKVLIGEKLPVFTSTAVQNAGVSTSVSYIDIGLKLEVEPQIYLNDEVGIKVNLEVNSNLGQVTQGGSNPVTAYNVGTRSATTALRLHDGETQVLAGLINDNDQQTISRVPGLAEIPALGHLFTNDNGNHEKTEIVLLITPRIIRNVVMPDYDTLYLQAGTEAEVGANALSIAATPPRSLAISGTEGGLPPRIERTERSQRMTPPMTAPADAADATANAPAVAGSASLPAPNAPVPGTGAGAAPAAASSGTLSASLSGPDLVAPGGKLLLTVSVPGAGAALEGEATVLFDASSLRTSDAATGTLTVHLSPDGSGGLTGTALFGVGSAANGGTDVRVTAAFAAMPDGTRKQADTSSAVLTVKIGI